MREAIRERLVSGARDLGVDLDEPAVGRFLVYLDLLRAWGRTMNLTSRLGEEEIVTRHFLDSLAAARLPEWGGQGRLVDVGCGAGFPGIPLKMAFPALEVLLLDSVGKKIAFCRQVIRETGLAGIRAEAGRAEEFARNPAHAGSYAWAATRAVARASRVASLSLPFLAPGGEALIYKGRPDPGEIEELEAVCRERGLAVVRLPVDVPGLEAARTILVVRQGRD